MNFVFILFSLKKGGASKAAEKFKIILDQNNLLLKIEVVTQDNSTVFQFFKRIASFLLLNIQVDGNPVKHSLNLFSFSPALKILKSTKTNIFHLHWINNDTLSIFNFDKIPTGSIITLHDEWIYCGAEHYYKISDNSKDFSSGYTFFKKGVYGLHWNYIIWKIKKAKLAHRRDIIFTVPSEWMLERAKSSVILKNADIRCLPNPINTEIFRPLSIIETNDFRKKLGISDSDFIFCFGAIGGKKNILKGANILEDSLMILKENLSQELSEEIIFVDFGGSVSESLLHGFRCVSMGYISSPDKLALIYSSADCVIVPSMIESFGQVAAESLSCETPVICFETSGLKDIIIDGETGLVCKPFDPNSMASQIYKMIKYSKEDRRKLGEFGRKHVIKNFSFDVIQKKYEEIILDAISLKDEVI